MKKIFNIAFLRIILLITLFQSLNTVHAQTYPVQVNLNTSGPYYNYLSYYADENSHLQAVVTLTDFNAAPVGARLRIKIEGPGYSAITKPGVVVGNSFMLTPGMPEFIRGIDLAPYFYQNNLLVTLSGANLNNLPEGFTTICVEVIKDSPSQEVLSTNNCTSFFLQRFQPSQLVFPNCGSSVNPADMFYTFQWTSPVGFVPSIGTEISYVFSLYEWNDPNNYNIFQTGQGLVYTAETSYPLVQLSSFDVTLQEGVNYVWRIKASILSNGLAVNMVENNGVSSPCTFVFGESQTLEESLAEGLTIDLNTSSEGERKGRAYWTVIDNTPGEGLSTFNSFVVSYRKQPTGNEGYEFLWFEDTVSSFSQFIYQLEPSTTYEVKVAGIAGSFTSAFTEVETFTTNPPRNYACGDQDLPFRPQTYTPLENALVGMVFQIGQFDMSVTEIYPTGGLGHYSGKGLIPVAFLGGAKAKVRFDDILVDDQYLVREGQVDVITKGVDNWLHEQYMQFIDPIYVNGTVDSAYVDTVNHIAWVTVNGVDTSFTFNPPDYPIIINDASGYQYTIWPNGTINISTYLEISDDYLEVGANEVVYFAQNEEEKRGFDAKQFMQWHEQYEIIQLPDSSKYFVANKSVLKNEIDFVDVEFPASAIGVTFQLANGTAVSSETGSNSNSKKITIPSFASAGEQSIYAFVNQKRVGKLNVIVFEPKEVDVVIVPLTNNSPSATQITESLNATLGEAGLTFKVSIAPQWNDSIYTSNKVISLPSDVGLMNKYSDDMRGLRDAYIAAHPDSSQDAYYLFVVAGFSDNTVDGYMVRGKVLGFIKSGADALTYAHELGHGVGALEHSWKNNGPTQGSTDNLMDYSSNTSELTKAQWDKLRSWNLMPSLWDEAEDAEGSSPMVYYFKVRLTSGGAVASRAFWKREKYVRLCKDGDWVNAYYTETDITRPVVVNYVFNNDWTLKNSYKYANVVYYNFEWVNNKWVRTIDNSSTKITIEGYDFPVWNVYTVFRYRKDYDIIDERIYGIDGREKDPAQLQANSNVGLGVPRQAAQFLKSFINWDLNSVFSNEEFESAYIKVSDGYDVKVTVYDKRGWTEAKIKTAEFVIHIDNAMSKADIIDLLGEYGLERDNSYEYYLFANDMQHTIERWANFQDQSVKTPPFAVQLLADILMGLPGAVYGFATGEDWRTGETLTGWDHVLNSLEIIPVAGAFAKSFKIGIKSFKVFNKTTNAVFDVIEAAKKIPPTVYSNLASFSQKGLRIAGNAANELYLVVNSTGQQIAKFVNNKMVILKQSTASGTPQWALAMDNVPIKVGDDLIYRNIQVRKIGNDVGVLIINNVRSIDDFIPSSGTQLIGNLNKTTTILGRWNPDMQVIKGKMLPNEFNVGTEFGAATNNNGGFNFLNIPDNLANASIDFFNQYNKPWLQQAIQRGDDIILATRPFNKSDFITATGQLKGMYAEELKFLVQQNYKPINLGTTEWNTIKTWFL